MNMENPSNEQSGKAFSSYGFLAGKESDHFGESVDDDGDAVIAF